MVQTELNLTTGRTVQRFDGETFDANTDANRLTGLLYRVKELMGDGSWRTLAQIQALTGGTEASVSARLRDLRKTRFGQHVVERRRVAGSGLYEYRVKE